MLAFTWEFALGVKRKLKAMLPNRCQVEVSVNNYGRTLGIMVASDLHNGLVYQFGLVGRDANNDGRQGPMFGNDKMLEIADQWQTGYVDTKAYQPSKPRVAPPTPYIRTKDAFVDWVAQARKGDTVSYFTGSLANFREDAAKRVVQLQKLSDQALGKRPRPPAERRELQRLQQTQEMLTHINLLYRKDLITLSQRRDLEGRGTSYLAIRKGNKMNVSHPYAEQKLHKEISQAIRGAWGRYAKDFTILAITYEGGTDNTHETTAVVQIYQGNPNDNSIFIRVPFRDLGENRKTWAANLINSGKKAAKQLKVRTGHAVSGKNRKISLDEI